MAARAGGMEARHPSEGTSERFQQLGTYDGSAPPKTRAVVEVGPGLTKGRRGLLVSNQGIHEHLSK